MERLKIVVTNASVIVKWFFADEPYSENARQLLEDYLSGRVLLVVPMFCLWEVANAFWVGVRRGRITVQEAIKNWQLFAALRLHLVPDPFPELVLNLALQLNASVYDSIYLLTAQQLDGEFWTADERLVQTVQGQLPFTLWLGEYPIRSSSSEPPKRS